MITVARLQVAPVKGLALVARDGLHLGPGGAEDDRRVLLLDDAGAVVTLRRHPCLPRVVPDLDLAGDRLTLTLPDGTRATSALSGGEPLGGRLFGKDRPGTEVGGPAAEALSELVGHRLRLLLTAPGVGTDEGPVSVVGTASAAAVGSPGLARLRMLVEVVGTRAYEEDGWAGRRVRLGDAVLHGVAPLPRCTVVEHDPATGARDWPGLKALTAARGATTLGVSAEVEVPGRVRVGDPVEVA